MSFVDLFAAMVLALVTLFASAFLLRVVAFGLFARRHGGCAHGHHGPHGHHGRHGLRGGWRLMRELRLTRAQRGEIRGLFQDLRGTLRELRGDLPAEVATLLGGQSFDRGAAEALAERQLAALDQVRARVLDALARLHALLTPEQRARVAAFASA